MCACARDREDSSADDHRADERRPGRGRRRTDRERYRSARANHPSPGEPARDEDHPNAAVASRCPVSLSDHLPDGSAVVPILPGGCLLTSTLLPNLSLSTSSLRSSVGALSLPWAVGQRRQARASAIRRPQSSRAGTCPTQGVGRRFCGLRSQPLGGTTDGRGPASSRSKLR